MRRGEPDEKTHGTHGFTPNELCIPRTTFSPSVKEGGQIKPGIQGPATNQMNPTDSNYIQDVKGFVSSIQQELKALDQKLKEIRKRAKGAVLVEMPLTANLDSSTKSGKAKKPLTQQNLKNYEMVLTWGHDSDNIHNRRKLELPEIPPPSGTEWKISIKPPVAGGSN